MTSHKKLRKLLVDANVRPSMGICRMCFAIINFIINLCAIFCIVGIFSGYILNFEEVRNIDIRNEFYSFYYGQVDYCHQKFQHENITRLSINRIIGQNLTIENLDEIFQKHQNFTSVALVGGVGVGKTLYLDLLAKNFQWINNIQYLWNLEESSTIKFSQLQNALKGLSYCGHNLIIIDNIQPTDRNIISNFNNEALTITNLNSYKLIILYAFTIPKFSNQYKINYEDTKNSLKNFVNIKTVYLRDLNENDLEACILKEAALLNLKLNTKQIDNIKSMLDVTVFGCKNVYAKVVLYI